MQKGRSKMDINTITTLAEDANRNYGKLPVIDYFDIDIVGVTGKCGERHITGFAIKVQCHGDGRVRLATDVAAEYGMKLPKNIIRVKDGDEEGAKKEAYKLALEYKAKWGKAKSAAGKAKEEAVAKAKTELVEQIAQKMREIGLSEEAIKTLTGNL